jgi:glycosyltransferase involved in cell wall biosynthesis
MADIKTPMFSILIPTWNNLKFLELCVRSIEKNSSFNHQIIIYVNDGSDGSLDYVKEKGLDFVHSPKNVGICFALNALRPLVKTDYIVYMNDDMYVCPQWDKYLWDEIQKMSDKMFFLSSTLIQPRTFYSKSIIAPANYGETVEEFDEKRLLEEYATLPHHDWLGATWPPNIVHRDIWDLVGGYSVELSPGMYSDPDFSAKLWLAGVRLFKGVSKSRVYHFEARSTGRITKNNGSAQFLLKYGITSATFMRYVLHRDENYPEGGRIPIDTAKVKANLVRSKLKRLFYLCKDFMPKKIWEE